jgi:uncharacterized membrane protein YqjE
MPYPPSASSTESARAEADGIFGHLSALLAAKLAYLRARLELAGLEGREAAVHYSVILGLAVAGAIALIFGYLFFIIAMVFLIASWLDGDHAWIWVMFGAAALHVIGAVVLLLIAKARLGVPMFAASLEELKHDQEWLKNSAKPN